MLLPELGKQKDARIRPWTQLFMFQTCAQLSEVPDHHLQRYS